MRLVLSFNRPWFRWMKRKLRHDTIYSSRSLRLSKSLIHCALILVQRMWPSLLNAGCKFQFCDKKTICIKQGKLYLCWNADYATLSRDVPISRISFIFNTSVCNQVQIPVANFNFSVKENPNRIFIICYDRKTSNVWTSTCIKLCMFCCFSSQIVGGSCNDRTVVQDIVTL